jgi:uncharacterized cupredoxin-like copper-binding protein
VIDPDPPAHLDPLRHVVAGDELDKLLAHDAAQRARERQETRAWMTGLSVGGALLGALALVVSLFALTHSTTQIAGTVAPPAAMAAAASTAPATAAPLGHAVTATLTEMKITDSVARVAAGNVRFTVTNRGSVTHEYVILRTTRPAAQLLVSGGRASEAGHVGEIGDLPVGSTKTLRLRLAPGHYSIICNLPGHYLGGMHADLTVS